VGGSIKWTNNLMPLSLIFPLIENILNYYIQLDPESHRHLELLHGKVIAIQSKHFDYQLYLIFRKNKIHINSHYEGKSDVTLKGTPFDFLRLSSQSDNASVVTSDIEITGDMEVAENFKTLFAELEIDWEEQLSKFTGDIIAYQVGNFVRSFSSWAKQSMNSLQQNITEYAQEELRLTPSNAEVQDFFSDIITLHHDVERMDKRLHRLIACL
jgi:ubiquinone biosynthesis protein UbiJ